MARVRAGIGTGGEMDPGTKARVGSLVQSRGGLPIEVERRLVAKAKLITIDGSTDAFMLCSGTTANRWSKAKPLVDEAINSFKADPAADFSEAMV